MLLYLRSRRTFRARPGSARIPIRYGETRFLFTCDIGHPPTGIEPIVGRDLQKSLRIAITSLRLPYSNHGRHSPPQDESPPLVNIEEDEDHRLLSHESLQSALRRNQSIPTNSSSARYQKRSFILIPAIMHLYFVDSIRSHMPSSPLSMIRCSNG